ncbi:MAG: hypothetical protein ACT4QF_04805 [Sporichthyaceae bacterium]
MAHKTTATVEDSALLAPTIELLDPATLLVDLNVRHDARLDPAFLASVKEHGVLVPIVAVRTAEGAVRVRFGHRRTLAAVEVARPVVPVVLVADEATDDAAQVERIVGQWAENEHRTSLTVAERVGALAQTEAGASGANLTNAAAGLPTELAGLARDAAARMGPRLEGGAVWTDDRAPVEWLTDKSLLDYATDR